MSSLPDSSKLQPLYDLIEARTGILPNASQRQDVIRLLMSPPAGLAACPNIETPDTVRAFTEALSGLPLSHPQWQNVLNVVTVGATYFYRNAEQFKALHEAVLPDLITARRREGNKTLRLWSAGCATGEEPYTLAMILRELMPDIGAWQVSLLATDVNMSSLEHAQRGIYRPWSFRDETPPHLRTRWFRARGEGFEIDPTLRDMVRFMPLNLIDDDDVSRFLTQVNGTAGFDLIVCRNVTLYFDPVTTDRVIGRFQRALADSGWLMVGTTERLTAKDKGFVPRCIKKALIYQKSSTCAAHLQPSQLGDPATARKPVCAKPKTAPLRDPAAKTGQLRWCGQ